MLTLTGLAGTGIQLLGNVTDADFSLFLDGIETPHTTFLPDKKILATIQNLSYGAHSITLQVLTPETQDPPGSHTVFFDKALIITAAPAESPPK